MLKSIKNNYFLIISIFLILYFFFNLLSGQRGLISYFEKKQSLKKDIEFILSAKSIVIGGGSFVPALMLFSKNIKKHNGIKSR